MAQVNAYQKEKDGTLDTVLTGLQIASTAKDLTKGKKKDPTNQSEAMNRRLAGTMSPPKPMSEDPWPK